MPREFNPGDFVCPNEPLTGPDWCKSRIYKIVRCENPVYPDTLLLEDVALRRIMSPAKRFRLATDEEVAEFIAVKILDAAV